MIRGFLEDRSRAISSLLATDLANAGVDLESTSLPVMVAIVSGAADDAPPAGRAQAPW